MSRPFEEELNRANVPYNIHEALRIVNVLMHMICIRALCHRLMRICEDDDIDGLAASVQEYRECINIYIPNFNLTYNEGVIIHFALRIIISTCYGRGEYLYLNWRWNSSDDDSDPEIAVQEAVNAGVLRI